MTGEYFALLSKYSILSVSIAETTGLAITTGSSAEAAFRQGIKDSSHTNLLHQSFLVRTRQLFGQSTKEENYYYLSGLLIGTECRELKGTLAPVTIVSEGRLRDHYHIALQTLAITDLKIQSLDEAVIRGQAKILALKK
jgi:2-dehydro-3-deoxygalactonokinase